MSEVFDAISRNEFMLVHGIVRTQNDMLVVAEDQWRSTPLHAALAQHRVRITEYLVSMSPWHLASI